MPSAVHSPVKNLKISRNSSFSAPIHGKTTKNEIKNVKYLSNPQKIKIIEKLNLYGFLQAKGFSKTNFEFLLSQLFDISDKQVRTSLSNKKHDAFAENFVEELKNRPSIRT